MRNEEKRLTYRPPSLVRPPRDLPFVLVVDDKYEIDGRLNQSHQVLRLCDLMRGDIGDIHRVRAHPVQVARATGPNRLLPGYRVMWLINPETLAEGGWITTSAGSGHGYTEKTDGYAVAPPVMRIAQIGDIVILTADDLISVTPDGDEYTLANIRHDAHHHYDIDHDGRIYFTTSAPGVRPAGPTIIGEMVGDPAKANFDTALNKETVEWCPQVAATFPLDTIIFPDPGGTYGWPTFQVVPNSIKRGAAFPTLGGKLGWSSETQLPSVYNSNWHLALYIEYAAVGDGGDAATTAIFDLDYKVVSPGESLSTAAGTTAASIALDVAAAASAETFCTAVLPLISAGDLAAGDLILVKDFYRDFDDALDTYGSTLLIIGYKWCWTDSDPSPLI